jgi:glyoxylate carboligase
MEIVHDEDSLTQFVQKAVDASPGHPILIDKFLEDAIEIDVDAVSDGKNCVIAGIMEHIEEAGVHSGDSACVTPPYSLVDDLIDQLREHTCSLAKELEVIGLMNVQYSIRNDRIYVLEVNPRASRTVPFVSKATGVPWAKLATEIMLGKTLEKAFADHGRAELGPWLKRVAEWKEKHPLRYEHEGQKYILPQWVVEKLWEKTQGKAVVTTGVGMHQMFAAQYWKTSYPRQFITSGGLGTMGFCLPAAIGAQLGRPDALVIGIDGDGSFQMTLQDLATAVDLQLPIKIFVLNNLFLGMVRQWQELFYDRRFAETPLSDRPDLVKLADAYGCLGLRARTPDELDGVLDRALAHTGGPVIVDIRVRRQEKVFPMVPAGAPLNDMIDGEER